MIKISNNKFTYAGVSFSVPNDMYLVTNSDIVQNSGMEFEAEDDEFNIVITFSECDGTAEGLLQAIMEDFDTEIYKPISEINLNGLTGSYAVYSFPMTEIYEIQLDPVENYDENCAVIISSCKSKTKIGDVMEKKQVKDFLKNIRKNSEKL